MAVTQGCQGGGAGLDVSGRWAMFAFEDPVAVELQQSGDVLAGNGCCSGLGADRGFNCCGLVTGRIAARRAAFEFSFGSVDEPYVYATDAYVSADGRRMAGTFSRITSSVAWVRIGPGDTWLPNSPTTIDLMVARSGGYMLAVSDAPVGGTDFSAQEMHRVHIGSGFVFGALGSYWAGEMTWSADQQTLVVGPVPETAPGLPVQLRLHFAADTLTSVEATMASGLRYTFQAVAAQP